MLPLSIKKYSFSLQISFLEKQIWFTFSIKNFTSSTDHGRYEDVIQAVTATSQK